MKLNQLIILSGILTANPFPAWATTVLLNPTDFSGGLSPVVGSPDGAVSLAVILPSGVGYASTTVYAPDPYFGQAWGKLTVTTPPSPITGYPSTQAVGIVGQSFFQAGSSVGAAAHCFSSGCPAVTYQVFITGPTTTPQPINVGVNISGSAQALEWGPFGNFNFNAQASLSTGSGGINDYAAMLAGSYATFNVTGANYSGGCGSGSQQGGVAFTCSFSDQSVYTLLTNTVYTVTEQLILTGSISDSGAIQLTGNVDPQFFIDLPNADAQGYSIEISSGADGTPLPAALPLLATGLGALGLLGWRRNRKAQAGRL